MISPCPAALPPTMLSTPRSARGGVRPRIGTAFERIKLLPTDAQPGMRDLFRRYLDARLETYRNPDDTAATAAAPTPAANTTAASPVTSGVRDARPA